MHKFISYSCLCWAGATVACVDLELLVFECFESGK